MSPLSYLAIADWIRVDQRLVARVGGQLHELVDRILEGVAVIDVVPAGRRAGQHIPSLGEVQIAGSGARDLGRQRLGLTDGDDVVVRG